MMKKDVEAKKSNENGTMKKIIENYPDKLMNASTILIIIKKKNLCLPRFCSAHPKEKK